MTNISPYIRQRPAAATVDAGMVPFENMIGDGEVRLRDYWRVLRKHRWSIVGCFLIVEMVTAIMVLLTPSTYRAETTLMIEQQIPKIVDIPQDVLSDSQNQGEYDYYKTQYSILQSRSLAEWVIEEQGLKDTAVFTGADRQGLIARLGEQGKQWMQWGRSFITEETTSPKTVVSPQTESALVEYYLEKVLTVDPIKKTRLVTIAMTTRDPVLSARLANAHADAYLHFGLALRARPTEEAEGFLRKKLGELQARVQDSEAALNRYRREKRLLSLDDKENIVVERLSDLNKRLTEVEAARIALEAQVLLIRKREYDALPKVTNHALIQALKTRLSQIEGDYARLATEFKPTYPELAQIRAQVEETRNRLQRETQDVVAAIQSEYLATAENERALRRKMEEQKNAALALKDVAVEYAVLNRELDTNRQLYQSVLQKMKEMGVAAQMRASNVVVIDKAQPPRTPNAPKKAKAFAFSVLVGIVGGIAVAFLREYADNTLDTPEAVEGALHLPTLALVPDFLDHNTHRDALRLLPHGRSRRIQAMTPEAEFVLDHHPLSVVAESYRMLRTAILLSRAEEPPKTILFTSGVDQEGKTLTVLNTAVMFAHMNARVLVIDADLRRSGCQRMLGTRTQFGLTELLTGQRQLYDVLCPIENKLFSFIGSGSVPPNPAELLGSRKMHDVLATLQERYDYILVDAPPVIPVTDAVVLSVLVDGVVFVVDSQSTSRDVAQQACARLRYARAKVIGVVLNRMDVENWEEVSNYRSYAADREDKERVRT